MAAYLDDSKLQSSSDMGQTGVIAKVELTSVHDGGGLTKRSLAYQVDQRSGLNPFKILTEPFLISASEKDYSRVELFHEPRAGLCVVLDRPHGRRVTCSRAASDENFVRLD
jgi:hypothetical protein